MCTTNDSKIKSIAFINIKIMLSSVLVSKFGKKFRFWFNFFFHSFIYVVSMKHYSSFWVTVTRVYLNLKKMYAVTLWLEVFC